MILEHPLLCRENVIQQFKPTTASLTWSLIQIQRASIQSKMNLGFQNFILYCNSYFCFPCRSRLIIRLSNCKGFISNNSCWGLFVSIECQESVTYEFRVIPTLPKDCLKGRDEAYEVMVIGFKVQGDATLTLQGFELLGVVWVFISHLPLIHFPLEGK